MNPRIPQIFRASGLGLFFACAPIATGFDQGNYLVFSLVDDLGQKEVIQGRLKLSEDTFSAAVTANNSTETASQNSSDFVMDYTRPIQDNGGSSFSFTFAEMNTTEEVSTDNQTSFEIDSFDFSQSSTVFGE